MSTANVVPETWELTGDDARRALRESGVRSVLVDGARRFRWADGFSHSRALAFQIILTFVPAVLVAAGIAVLTDSESLRRTIVGSIRSIVPGPAGDVFEQAAEQGAKNAASVGGAAGLAVAALAMTISAATAFGQIERGTNRIYGVEQDRPMRRKYATAAGLAASAGVLLGIAFVLLAVGRTVTGTIARPWRVVWVVGRWPLGIAVLVAAEAIVFKVAPKRRQPRLSWLAFGACIAAASNVVASVGLSAYLGESGDFDATYGPVAGLLGVMMWAYLLSIGLFYGLSVAAQLEAVRAGRAEPQSEEKVADSEPASVALEEAGQDDDAQLEGGAAGTGAVAGGNDAGESSVVASHRA